MLARVIDLNQFASVDASIRRRRYGAGVACAPLGRRGPAAGYETELANCAPAGGCRDMISTGVAVLLAGVVGTALPIPIAVRMRVDSILIVTSGAAGFTVQDFTINNVPQWTIGQVLHSAIFAPGADANTAFKGDMVSPGSTVTLTVNNLDAVNPQTIWVHLKGPGA